MSSEVVSKNIQETLGKKTPGFIASVASLVNSNEALQKADKKSVLLACLTAATLDLPINQNLGFAYIIPYKGIAQFQMGWKGFMQLALRSGNYKTINVTDVREGEIKSRNRLTGEFEYSWITEDREKMPVIGFVAYFRLTTGFEKTFYMTVEQLKAHGIRYSQTAKKGYGLWKDDFEAMASKTVLKLALSKYGLLSTELISALQADQALITEEGFEYVDNKPLDAREVAKEKETERILKHIKNAKTQEELEACKDAIQGEELEKAYNQKSLAFAKIK